MATVKEMMMDAAASVDTAAMMSAGDTFEGEITPGDEDWISIELSEGKEYTITVGGGDATADPKELNDSVLKLMDGKGGLIDMNDDVDGVKGELNSEIKFTPEAGSGTQTYYISVSGYSGNPGAINTGTYMLSVTAIDVLPAGEGADLEGGPNADKITGTDDSESIAGLGGNDSIFGGAGDDSLSGGAGNDLLVGGAGADIIKGGADEDTVSYMGSPMGVNVNLRAGTASGGDAEGDELEDIENVMGSMYDDTLSGSRVINKMWGLGGNDTLFGDKEDDMLDGGDGDDSLDGGDGDDTLEGGAGADVLTGGEDDDRASYANSMMGVTVRLHASQAMGGDAEGDTWGDMVTVEYTNPDPEAEDNILEETVPDIVHLTGSAMADTLAGDSRDNMISGGGGDDKIYGGPGGGDDTLEGGMGNDMLFGGIGADTLKGDGGDDMLNGGAGNDIFYGGAGSDMIYADDSDTTINGWLSPEDAAATATALGIEDDTATTVNEATDEVARDPMTVDTVSYERLEEAVQKTLGAGGITNIENIIGTSENDTLTGDGGNNVIEGGDGADGLNGGAGNNTVSYVNSDRRVSIDLDNSNTNDGSGIHTASGGHAQGDTLTDNSFANIIGSAHDDILEGDENANVLTGLAGDDELVGSTGSDTLEGGAGADELDGGTASAVTDGTDTDSDTLSYEGSSAGVSANLATHSYSGGDAEGDEIKVNRGVYDHDNDAETDALDVSTFEYLTGSMHNDRLTGDHRMNTIMGGDGDDTISGGGAMDVLNGGKGDDSIKGDAGGDHLIGGPGADRLDGGEMRGERDNMVDSATDGIDNDNNGTIDDETGMIASEIDWAVYRDAMAGVTVDLSTGRGTGGEAMGDRLVGIELIWGSLHADTFIAAADEDTFDIIHGDAGSDTMSYEASETGVVVDLGNTTHHTPTTVSGTGTETDPFVFPGLGTGIDPAITQIAAGVGATGDSATNVGTAATNGAFGDRLASIENLTGSDQRDILGGDANPNVLKGMGGNDTLTGVGGNDMLYGGAGRDVITGGLGDDTIVGGAGDNDELTGNGGNDTFVFAPGDGNDIINDFNAAEDKLNLSAFGLAPDDLQAPGVIDVRGQGANARVFVTVGDVTIELVGVTDIDAFDTSRDPNDSTTILAIDNDSLDLGENADGTTDTGIFIL